MKNYGKNSLDQELEKIEQTREIAKTIMGFNLPQKQLLNLIYFLALGLENNEQMVEITTTVRSFEEKSLFIDNENKENS